MMAKSCGTCKHFTKLKYAFRGRALCEKYDIGWCTPDSYKNCDGWEAKKYSRNEKHKNRINVKQI